MLWKDVMAQPAMAWPQPWCEPSPSSGGDNLRTLGGRGHTVGNEKQCVRSTKHHPALHNAKKQRSFAEPKGKKNALRQLRTVFQKMATSLHRCVTMGGPRPAKGKWT